MWNVPYSVSGSIANFELDSMKNTGPGSKSAVHDLSGPLWIIMRMVMMMLQKYFNVILLSIFQYFTTFAGITGSKDVQKL